MDPNNIEVEVEVNKQMQLHQLRLRIQKNFGLGKNDFYIKTNNGPLAESYYDYLIKDL